VTRAHAFSCAGTKVLLVTNRFRALGVGANCNDRLKRRAADPKLARSEALRQAMTELVDGRVVWALMERSPPVVHPSFWEPYPIIGDSGDRRTDRDNFTQS